MTSLTTLGMTHSRLLAATWHEPLTPSACLEVEVEIGSGDRKWKGAREETSHHCVTQVTRETATVVAPSPLTAPDEMMSLTAIGHLDFEPDVTCDARDADDDAPCPNHAWAVVVTLCRDCRAAGRQLVCAPCWDVTVAVGWVCGWKLSKADLRLTPGGAA